MDGAPLIGEIILKKCRGKIIESRTLFRVSALKATAAEVHRVKDPLLRVSTLKATAAEVPRKYIESKMIAGRRQSALEARSQTGPTIGSPRLHAELNKRTFVGC